MKSKKTKQTDLDALTQQFQEASAAMVVGFNKLTVSKDQELREQLRSAGAEYKVVKNTLARRAAKGTPFEAAEEHFKGVSAVAFVKDDGIALSKTLTKFLKENPEIFSFKAGIVEGKVVDLSGIQTLASLPSREELMSKLLFLLNAPAQRLATVIKAVPRNLAVVVKQASEKLDAGPAAAPEAAPVAASEEVAEAAPEAATEATPEEAVEAAPKAVAEVTPEVAPEPTQEEAVAVAPEATAEATPEAEPEAVSEAVPEEAAEATPETTAEAAPEAVPAVTSEEVPEAESEAKPEA